MYNNIMYGVTYMYMYIHLTYICTSFLSASAFCFRLLAAGGCCGLGRVNSFAESARFLVTVAASLSLVMLVDSVCNVCKGMVQ